MYVRASIGTLASLGLLDLKMFEKPYTAYILQYSEDGCQADCLFCPQSRTNFSRKDFVSRVVWPRIELNVLIKAIKAKNVFSRLCIQNVIKQGFKEEFIEIIRRIRKNNIKTPISASITPISRDYLDELKELDVDYLGVGLDAATPEVFVKIKKPYTWETYINFIKDGVSVFGKYRVNVHLIFGLGETEKEFVKTMKTVHDVGGKIALFAFTPVKGTALSLREQPSIYSWRKIQLAKYIIENELYDKIVFVKDKICFENSFLRNIINDLKKYLPIFLTSGCPSCNRPFYNESPKGPYYNFPSIPFAEKRIKMLKNELLKITKECDVYGQC